MPPDSPTATSYSNFAISSRKPAINLTGCVCPRVSSALANAYLGPPPTLQLPTVLLVDSLSPHLRYIIRQPAAASGRTLFGGKW